VPGGDLERRESLRSGDGDVGSSADVEHGASDEPGSAADPDQREGDERKGKVAEPVGDFIPAGQEIGIETGGAKCRQRAGPVGKNHDQHEAEPVAWNCKEGDRQDRQRCIHPSTSSRLYCADRDADQITQQQREANQEHRRRPRLGDHGAHRPPRSDTASPVTLHELGQPARVLLGQRPVESERLTLSRHLFRRGCRPDEQLGRVAGGEPDEKEHERDYAADDCSAGDGTLYKCTKHGLECTVLHPAAASRCSQFCTKERSASMGPPARSYPTPKTTSRAAGWTVQPIGLPCFSLLGINFPVPFPERWLLLVLLLATACGSTAERRGNTILFASGADLQSINPLLTVHPLARQVQRYVLLTTLARYDSSLTPRPYLARSWDWSSDRRRLTFHLENAVRWHDGRPTTAGDVVWTLNTARDPGSGYARSSELGDVAAVTASNDSTVVLQFRRPLSRFPDLLTDLAILPAHRFTGTAASRLRQAAWNTTPVGNGPFRFVAHEPNRRWVFAANPDFPASLGGPPKLDRFIVVVVNEPTTKLAALTSGELDFAGIQPAHAAFVRKDPRLAVVSYPLLWTDGVVFNLRRSPFNRLAVRRAVNQAIDRKELVEGYAYGFATPATGPVPPTAPGYLAITPALHSTTPPPERIRFELLTVGSGEAALEQMLQARLARAGFDVVIRQLELSAFLARVYGPAHDFDAAVLGIPGDLGLAYLGPLAALAGVRAPTDPVLAQRLFADSLPVAFLYHSRGLQGMNRRVKGVTMDLRGELPTIHDWYVTSR
jgi:peptide/nickel transport system substrate-binding protein